MHIGFTGFSAVTLAMSGDEGDEVSSNDEC